MSSNILIRVLFLFGMTGILCQSLRAQPRTQGKPFVRNFEPLEYNGEGQNWAVAQDDLGYMYFANTGGFLIYDGVRWNKIRPHNDGVPLCLKKASNGLIYGAGTDFVGYFDPKETGTESFISLANELPKEYEFGFIRSIIEYENKVYFQADSDILIWDGTNFEIIKTGLNLSQIILLDSEILGVTSTQVFRVMRDETEYKMDSVFWSKNVVFVRSILPYSEKRKLIATYHNGLYWLENGITKPVSAALNHHLIKSKVHTMLKLPNGDWAFATKKDGVLITDRQLIPKWRLNKESGIQEDDIKGLFVDVESNLWTAKNRGLSSIEYPIELTYFDVISEELGTIEDIQEFGGSLFLGSVRGTLKVVPVNASSVLSNSFLPTFQEIPMSSVDNFALKTTDQGLLFGGLNGVHIYNGSKSKKLSANMPRKILVSRFDPQRIYVGGYSDFEIFEFEGGQVTQKRILDLPFGEYRGIAETTEGDLWVTTVTNGILFVDLEEQHKIKHVDHYDIDDGLPSERDNLVYNVDDQIYFTTHKGIYVFDSLANRFKPDSTFGDIYGNETRFVYSFFYDGKDEVWLNAYDKRETGHVVKQPDGTWKLEQNKFTAMNQMQMYDIYAQEDGVVWFGGSDALVRYEPAAWKPKRKSFRAMVRKVALDGDSVVLGGSGQKQNQAVFNPQSRNVRFEVAALTFRNSAVTDYQYRLVGLEEDWSEWTKETFRIYTNLSKGSYQLKVRAKNEFNELSFEDSYTFVILPYWYETWWFRSLVLIVIVGITWFMIRFFSQRKLIKKVEEMEAIRRVEKERDEAIIQEKQKGIESIIKAQEEERQRIAKDLHDGIVQEIGSNIIRWRGLFSEDKPPKEKADQLIESLENSNAELRALSHQMMPKALSALGVIAALEGLLDTSLKPTEISFEFEYFGISERLPENIEITLYRVCQELIQNILKHSQATEVNVQLFKAGPDINLIVEDNGVGFDRENMNEGIGLHNIKSRLDHLNGEANFEPSPQKGTLVTVKIPLT